MFPVHMKAQGSKPPDSVPHYIVAKNGIFLKKESWWMEAVIPVKQISVLEEQETSILFKFPPLSALVLAKAWKFFQAVYRAQRTEAAVLLHYSEKLGWDITVPKQKAMYGHVDYQMTDRIPRYVLIGTMHSHSSMGAFHSGTDVPDEAQFDGIHITLGNVDEEHQFSMDAEVVVNGARFALPLTLLEGVTALPEKPPTYFQWRSAPRYAITCPELEGWSVPDEWVRNVTASRFRPAPTILGPNGKLIDWSDLNGDQVGTDESPVVIPPLSESKEEAT